MPGWRLTALFKRMVREGLNEKVTFEQRFEGIKEASYAD